MKRSRGQFLLFFIIAVGAGASLIWLLPAALGDDATVQSWIPAALGAIFAASAFVAWKVRPNWKQTSPT
ncbi:MULTISPECIES: hypothetical protein [Microbacterium]|jgi:hypothetical protein|uniref:hypothetical protein n=1 Tax=Microbacterium TaxID=33882 RepID=UPI000FF2C019|nr:MULTISPECIES: hypothetical protein [Microbacterium]RKE63309.1 hypothetical protein DEU36_0510 [Microbacterium sp. AG238]WJM17047.1 hypothetical protein QUC20_07020 [Microbacterium arborescens]